MAIVLIPIGFTNEGSVPLGLNGDKIHPDRFCLCTEEMLQPNLLRAKQLKD